LVGTIIIYVLSRKNLLSPIFILFGLFTLSTFAIVIDIDYYGIDISFKTYFVLLFSLIFWGIGDLYAKFYYSTYKKQKSDFIVEYAIKPSNAIFTISILIVSSVSYLEFSRFIKIGEHLGGTNFLSYYVLIRNYVVEVQNFQRIDNVYPLTGFVASLITLSKIIAYSYIFIFIFNITYGYEKKFKYLIPAFLYIPILLFSSSRSSFIEFFSWCFIISILIRYQAKGWGIGNNKILKKMLIPSLVLMIGFYSLGFVRSAGVGPMFTNEMFDSLSKYMGSSIFGLDYLLDGHIPQGRPFARETFPIIYTILEKVGYKINHVPLHSEFFYWKTDGANIYTALRNPIIDFSIVGMYGTRVILGFLYGLLIRHFVYYRNNPYNILEYVVFPMFYYPLIMYSFGDLFHSFLNFDFIYTLFFLYVINKAIIKKSKILIEPAA
jgi:oligosaccharide repeat unit polymerase